MAVEKSLTEFDPAVPHRGASVKSQVLTDQMQALATGNAGSSQPAIPARIIGDIKFATLNLSVRKLVTITVGTTTRTDIDLSSSASNVSAVTPDEVVDAINTAFSASFAGEDVAYVYSKDITDNTAYVMLQSPATITGSTAVLTVDNGTGTANALDTVFGISSRGVTPPYTVNGVDLPVGYKWYSTSEGDDDSLNVHLDSPATAIGVIDLDAGVDTNTRHNLRIKLTGVDGTPTGTIGPVDIDVGRAPFTTATAMVTAINAAFKGEAGWPNGGAANGPASVVTRNGSGSYIKIVSGPYDDPSTGPTTSVVISEASPTSVDYLKDDAIEEIFGFSSGVDMQFAGTTTRTNVGDRMSNLPHTFAGATFTTAGIRGWNDRSGPGIGPWGKMMSSILDIPSAGVVEGEVRTARNTGIPWIYRNRFGETGWLRAIPTWEWPLSYDRKKERYTLKRVTDVFVAQPFDFDFNNVTLAGHIDASTGGSMLVETVDAQDIRWPNTTYPKHASESGNPRNLHRDNAQSDSFRNAGVLGATSGTLASSRDGGGWTQTANRTWSSGGAPGAAISFAYFTPANTEDRCFYHHAAGHLYTDDSLAGDGSATSFSTTIADPDFALIGNNIRSRSIHVVVVDVDQTYGTYTATAVAGFGDGTASVANIVGLGFTGTNTVNLTSGQVTLNFVAAPTSTQQILISFSIDGDLSVAVDVSVGSNVQGGNLLEAGLLYACQPTAVGVGIDTDYGYVLRCKGDGVGQIFRREGSSSEVQVGSDFVFDPPISTYPRTLRVVYRKDPATGNAVHTVLWGGSYSVEDWIRRELVDESGDLVGTNEGTRGGEEISPNLTPVMATITETAPNNYGNTHCGFYTKAVSAAGLDPAKDVFAATFQIHGGKARDFTNVKPGLPPVSAIRTRDSIHSVRLSKDGVIDTSGIITDCNHETPLLFDVRDDLATGSAIDVANRKITLGLNLLEKLSGTDLIWSPTNTDGIFAFWAFGDDEEGYVDLSSTSNLVTPVSFGANAAGPGSTFFQPGTNTYLTTTLPPRSSSWFHLIVATVIQFNTRDPNVIAHGATPSAVPTGRRPLQYNPASTTYLEFQIPWVSNYLVAPSTASVWGFAIRLA